MTQYLHGTPLGCPKCPGLITCSRCNTVAVGPTVRQSDSYIPRVGDVLSNPFGAAEVVQVDPYLALAPIRDPGNYVGVHRRSYSWALKHVGQRSFNVNIGMHARR